MRVRIAPTPSGFLHAGNVGNLLLIDELARARSGRVTLRIDDMDVPRYRPEYVDDLFDVLEWLGIGWHDGPRDRADFERHFRMADRSAQYRARLRLLRDGGLVTYCCVCSRSQARESGVRGCVGDCRRSERAYEPGACAIRAVVPRGLVVRVGQRSVDLHAEFGDPVVWRRDDLPAYHLASLDEDVRSSMTDIVRGADLVASTGLQAWLAAHGPDGGLSGVTFWHHDLVTDDDGGKLSKSQLRHGPMPRTQAARGRLRELAARLRRGMTADRVSW